MGQIPSGLAHPDGVRLIKNASSSLSIARKKMMKAHSRLDEFLESGIVPEDLKRSSSKAGCCPP
jgi:predicted naringenin-chalcone synthase